MKIVHTLLRYPPASGGVEDYTKELVEGLRKKQHDVRVETTNLRTHHPPSILDPDPVDPPYVYRHGARTFDSVGYPIPEDLRAELEIMEMDILHAHAFWYAPADIAARVAKKRNIPFVLNTYYYNTENRRSMKWQLYRILYGRATVAAADAVVVISPYEHELLKKDKFLLDRVELIPPGINSDEFEKIYENPFPAWRVTEKNILFYAGRIARAKGVDLLVTAFEKVLRQKPDSRLVISGEDFGYKLACQAIAKKLGIENKITWTGKVTREQLIGAMQHANIFVFPSRYEAFGIVLLEAAAAGCPVVATDATAIPFVVRHEKTGLLFEPENTDDLADKILTALNNESLMNTLTKQARLRAHTEFTWEQSINKLISLYEDLLQNKPSEKTNSV